MKNARTEITVSGAREHNLKNVDLTIERGKITVITGVSGSGKSSLAFDTILAESRRRFFYTLSHYSRQFLDLSSRPSVRAISGLSPSIYLAQNETPPSRRASIATLTDMGEMLGVFFSRFGQQFCPKHGEPTLAFTSSMMVDQLLRDANGKMVILCAPIAEAKKGNFKSTMMALAAKGFLRVWINGTIHELEHFPNLSSDKKHTVKLIVDGLKIKPESQQRIQRSIENALEASQGILEWFPTDYKGDLLIQQGGRYSLKAGCQTCGYAWPKLDPRYFAANSLGKCPACEGRGYLGLSKTEMESWDAVVEDDEAESENRDDTIHLAEKLCDTCMGTGLDPKLYSIKFGTNSILDVHKTPLGLLEPFLESLQNDTALMQNKAAGRILDELLPICRRLTKMGLGYLTLSRRLFTLSAGELQRIKLAGILGGRLHGILYVLDEPSQGLHHLEVNQIAEALVDLKKDGSTVIVVDHDEGFMKYADWIVDLGPGGGQEGGHLVAKFKPQDALRYADQSLTARYLSQNHQVDEVKKRDLPESPGMIEVREATIYNLQIPVARFPLSGFTVVTGVSGAGKSSLVIETLYPRLLSWVQGDANIRDKLSPLIRIVGESSESTAYRIEMIDRKKIAKSSVSIPASYLDVLSDLRDLFGGLPESQILGLSPRSFSLAVEGGRCGECKGRGVIQLKMRFLADSQVVCPLCRGERFTSQVLSVRYLGYHIAQILDMSLSEVADLLVNHKKIVGKIAPALELGLGYLKLGQPTASLSGGEAQRLKLVPHFYQGTAVTKKRLGKGTILIMDEPTTGLHIVDVKRLIKVIQQMAEAGTTIIAIEHHPEVMRAADWNLEIGPGAANEGGRLVYEGPPKL